MTSTVGIKSLVNCSFICSSKDVFPPKVINKENKITRLCIGKFFREKSFLSPVSVIYIAIGILGFLWLSLLRYIFRISSKKV